MFRFISMLLWSTTRPSPTAISSACPSVSCGTLVPKTLLLGQLKTSTTGDFWTLLNMAASLIDHLGTHFLSAGRLGSQPMKIRGQSQFLTSAVPFLRTTGAHSSLFSPTFCDSRTNFLMLSVPNIGNLYSLPGRSHEKRRRAYELFQKERGPCEHGPLDEG